MLHADNPRSSHLAAPASTPAARGAIVPVAAALGAASAAASPTAAAATAGSGGASRGKGPQLIVAVGEIAAVSKPAVPRLPPAQSVAAREAGLRSWCGVPPRRGPATPALPTSGISLFWRSRPSLESPLRRVCQSSRSLLLGLRRRLLRRLARQEASLNFQAATAGCQRARRCPSVRPHLAFLARQGSTLMGAGCSQIGWGRYLHGICPATPALQRAGRAGRCSVPQPSRRRGSHEQNALTRIDYFTLSRGCLLTKNALNIQLHELSTHPQKPT